MLTPTRRSRATDTGVVIGRVTRVTPTGPYLEVPALAPGVEYGPVLSTVAALAAGDDVVACFQVTDPDTPVILGKLV